MYTEENRRELASIFQQLVPQVTKTLEEEVLPERITHNGQHTGITIKFRKLPPNNDSVALSDD